MARAIYGVIQAPVQNPEAEFSIEDQLVLTKKIKASGGGYQAVFEKWNPKINPLKFQRTQDIHSYLKECNLQEKEDYLVILLD